MDALYPMGDRGGTATVHYSHWPASNYTRWEIGGEPQPEAKDYHNKPIIPDGRSGGNRNDVVLEEREEVIIPDGRSGGNRNRTSLRISG